MLECTLVVKLHNNIKSPEPWHVALCLRVLPLFYDQDSFSIGAAVKLLYRSWQMQQAMHWQHRCTAVDAAVSTNCLTATLDCKVLGHSFATPWMWVLTAVFPQWLGCAVHRVAVAGAPRAKCLRGIICILHPASCFYPLYVLWYEDEALAAAGESPATLRPGRLVNFRVTKIEDRQYGTGSQARCWVD